MPVVVVRYVFSGLLKIAFRDEWYSDKREILINTADGARFAMAGRSVNLDYHGHPLVLPRADGHWLKACEFIFSTGEKHYSSLSLALIFFIKQNIITRRCDSQKNPPASRNLNTCLDHTIKSIDYSQNLPWLIKSPRNKGTFRKNKNRLEPADRPLNTLLVLLLL